jgi:hypothetical protein
MSTMNWKKTNDLKKAGLALLLLTMCMSCEDGSAPEPPPLEQPKKLIQIEWDDTSERIISHDVPQANYGRIHRINGDTLFLVYRNGQQKGHINIALRKSFDSGKTWEPVQILVKDNDPDYYGFGGGELLVLQNGWVVLTYEGRGLPDNNVKNNIQVKISKDKGESWGDPIIVARGRSWEPAMVQLPDGEVQLFYSSEAKWWPSPEPRPQEILMIRSMDNGLSWTEPETVAYTENKRDGMPVPLLLKDNKGIVFTIEGVGLAHSPWIIYSSITDNWNFSDLPTVQNNRRWLAVENIYGGAPYLVQLPTGETILSCHINGGRNISKWRFSTMAVFTGDEEAKNFRDSLIPGRIFLPVKGELPTPYL